MLRSSAARLGALLAMGALVGASAVACASDPDDIVTETFSVGPWDLAPESAGAASKVQMTVPLPKPAGDIAVKAIRWRLEDGDGREIPATDHRIHFHHIVAYSNRERDATCGAWYGSMGERFAAPGSERTALELPNGTAYFTNGRDAWLGNIDVMNLTDEPQPGIRIAYDITYSRTRDTLRDVRPYWLDAQGCPGSVVPVDPGAAPDFISSVSGRPFQMPRAGNIVAVRSHLHDGGIDVTLANQRGEVACTGTAVYDDGPGTSGGMDHGDGGMDHGDGGMDHGDGGMDHGGSNHGDGHNENGPRIVAIPLCKDLNFRVEAGDELTVTGRYRTTVAIADAMIKTIAYVAEDNPLPISTTTTRRPTTTGASATTAPQPGDGDAGDPGGEQLAPARRAGLHEAD